MSEIEAERKHHEFSPSTLQNREPCPGWLGTDSTNEKQVAGTKMHKASETGDMAGLTDEQIAGIEGYRDYVQAELADLGPGAEHVSEIRLRVDEEETTAGFCDDVMVSADGKRGKVIDLKTGDNAVEPASNNLQGMAYMLGLVFDQAPDLEEVKVAFVAPFQGLEGIVDDHTFTRDTFQKHYLRIKVVVARAKLAKARFKSGEILTNWRDILRPTTGTCLFCARIDECPAVHELALKTGEKYDPLVVPKVVHPMLIKDPTDAGKALKFFDVMQALAKAYRAKVTNKTVCDEGFMPDGYQLVMMSTRSIVDKKAFHQTMREIGMSEEQILEASDFTLGSIEQFANDAAPKGEKKAAVEELGNLLSMNGAVQEGPQIPVLKQKNAGKSSRAKTA